ncbi:MAG: ABC transporter permease subunit [Acidimicrobiales bacterium]
MISTLRSEWIKLVTVRMNAVLAIIAIAFPLVITVLTTVLIDPDDMTAGDLVGLVTGTSVVTGMLLGVIGAAGITGEFGFGTIRPTFAATPKRSRVIVAKAVITVVVGAVVEAVMVAVCFGVGSAVLGSRDGDISLSDADGGGSALVGIVCFAAIVSLLGFGLGMLIRSTPASVAVLILWPLVGESLIGALLTAAGVENAFKWLPYQAGFNLGNPDAGQASDSLGRWTGGLYFLVVTLVVTGLGAWSTSRRDA